MESIGYIDNLFPDHATPIPDDYGLFAMSVEPRDDLVVKGADICRGYFPEDYSFLFKIKLDNTRSAVTLVNISDQLVITLDTCSYKLNVSFGGFDCPYDIQFSLPRSAIYYENLWMRMALGISASSVTFYFECEEVGTMEVDLSNCVIACDEGIDVNVFQTPKNTETCGATSTVGSLQ